MLLTLCRGCGQFLFLVLVRLNLTDLTKSRVEHVERHPVALLSARNRDETLVVVILRLVDLDDAAADLADLIDLLATLADNSPHHIIRDEDLLR